MAGENQVQLEASLSLDKLITGLQQARNDTQKLVVDVGNTNKSIKDGFDQSGASVKALSAEINKISDATAKAFNPAIVGKYSESLKTINAKILESLSGVNASKLAPLQQQLAGVNGSFAQVQTTVKFLRDNINALGLTKDQIKELTDQFGTLDTVFQNIGEGSDGVVDKTNSLRSQLRAIKNELQTIDDPANPRFIQLTKEAAELQEAISRVNEQITLQASKTQLLDVGIEVIRGIAGGFAAAQGAAVLFGGENEDLQKTLVKVAAAMEVLNGLQELSAILNSKSAVSVFIAKTFHLGNAAAIGAETVALEGETLATEAATVAQEGLNVAMAANPAFILIATIGAVVAGLSLLSSGEDEAKKASERLNLVLNTQNRVLELSDAAITRRTNLLLAQAKEQGKGEDEITAIEQNALSQRLVLRQANLKDTEKIYDQLNDKAKKLAAQLGFNLKDLDQIPIDAIKDETLKKVLEDRVKLREDIADKENEIQVKQLEEQTQANEKSLKADAGYAEAREILAKKNSAAELAAQIESIEARKKLDLFNSRDNGGEQAKIEAQALKDIENLRRDFQNKQIENEISAQKAIVEATLFGSKEQFDAQVSILKLTAKEAENIEGLSAEKRKEIEAKLAHDLLELNYAYNIKKAQQDINPNIDNLNARLALVHKNTEEELAIRQALVIQQANLEKVSVENSDLSATEKAAKIKEIDAKSFGDRKALFDNFIKTSIQQDEAFQQSKMAISIEALQEIVNNEHLLQSKRIAAEKKILDLEIDDLKAQRVNKKEEYDKGVIDYLEYQTAINNIDAKIKDDQAKKKKLGDSIVPPDLTQIVAAFGKVGDAVSESLHGFESIYDEKIASVQKFIQALDTQISAQQSTVDKEQALSEKGLANNLDTEKRRLAGLQAQRDQDLAEQKKLQQQKAAIQKEEIVADSISQISNLVTASSELFKVLAFLGPIGVGIAAATTGVMVAGFVASKIAAFKAVDSATQSFAGGGTYDILKDRASHSQGGVGLYEERSGKKLAEFEGDEKLFIVNKGSSKKYEPLLDAINNDELGGWTYDDLRRFVQPSGLHFDMDKHQHLAGGTTIINVVPSTQNKEESSRLLERIAVSNEKLLAMENEKEVREEHDDKTIIKKGNLTRIIHKKKDGTV